MPMCYICRFFLFGADYATCAQGVDIELQSSICSYILGFRQRMGTFRMSCNLQCGPQLLNIYNNFIIIIFKRTHSCNCCGLQALPLRKAWDGSGV